MASDGSSDGLPPGREESSEHARHTGSAGQLGGDLAPSTQSDWSIEEVDVFPEPSCDATEENKKSNMEDTVEKSEDSLKLVLESNTDDEEGQGGSSAVPGETGEPKAKMKEDFGDINTLLVSSGDSMDESG